MADVNIKARRQARQMLVQALYQWQMASPLLPDLELQFFAEHDMHAVDVDYFREALYAIAENHEAIDNLFLPHLDRTLQQLDPIELSILRLSSYELEKRLEVPYRVVINEGVELAKLFGAEASHKYINGVLDKIATTLRATEKQK